MVQKKPIRTKKQSNFIPFLATILLFSLIGRITILVRQRSGSEFTQIDNVAILQIFLVILSVVLYCIVPFKNEIWKKISRTSLSILILYYIVSGFSAFWSPIPEYSLFRSVEYLSQILLVLIIFYYYDDFSRAESKALSLSMIAVLFGVCMTLKFAGLTYNLSRWHTNHYTVSAAILFCYCFGELLNSPEERRHRLRCYGFGAFCFLLLGTSIASFIAAGMGIIVAILLATRGRTLFIGLFVAIFFTLGLVSLTSQTDFFLNWVDIGKTLKFYSQTQDNEVTLTLHGRSLLWQLYIEEIKRSPIYGHGFAVSSRLAKYYTTNTHNGLLAVLLGTGAMGFSLVCWGGYQLIRELCQSVRSQQTGAVGCASAVTAALINNMSLSFIGEQWREPSLVFVTILSLHLLFVLKVQDRFSRSIKTSSKTMVKRRPIVVPTLALARTHPPRSIRYRTHIATRHGVERH